MFWIDFPGWSGEQSLECWDWGASFEKFDESNSAFLYQNEMRDGSESRFSSM